MDSRWMRFWREAEKTGCRGRQPVENSRWVLSGDFLDLARLDAGSTDPYPLNPPIADYPHPLQVWQPAALVKIMSVALGIPDQGSFPTNFANF